MRTQTRAALAVAIALAWSSPSAMAGEWLRDSAGNMLVPPTPAMSQKLFNPIEEAKNPACPKKEEVIKHYILSGRTSSPATSSCSPATCRRRSRIRGASGST